MCRNNDNGLNPQLKLRETPLHFTVDDLQKTQETYRQIFFLHLSFNFKPNLISFQRKHLHNTLLVVERKNSRQYLEHVNKCVKDYNADTRQIPCLCKPSRTVQRANDITGLR